MDLDPRLHVFRADLADERLIGRVQAERFIASARAEVAAPVAALRREARADAMRMTEALLGESVAVFERKHGWAWVQLEEDGYVGYLPEPALRLPSAEPTHKVAVPLTYVYPAPDLKSQPTQQVYLNSRLRGIDEGKPWTWLASGGFVFAKHLVPLSAAADAAAVAEAYEKVPYLWGGKTQAGLDCSGLVQLALHAAGHSCPRDTDMMERALGEPLAAGAPLRRGDLVFWKGHVGMMLDAQRLIHANAFHMLTAIEPLDVAVGRIATQYGAVTSVRRVA